MALDIEWAGAQIKSVSIVESSPHVVTSSGERIISCWNLL